MTDRQETSDTVEQLVNSDGGGRIRPAAPTGGQSVGGPAAASESATEAALTGSDDPVIGDTPAADDPARNPL